MKITQNKNLYTLILVLALFAAGISTVSAYIYNPTGSGGGGGVTTLNSLSGALNLVGSGGITITPSGSNITISGSGTPDLSQVLSAGASTGGSAILPSTSASFLRNVAGSSIMAIDSNQNIEFRGVTSAGATQVATLTFDSTGNLIYTGARAILNATVTNTQGGIINSGVTTPAYGSTTTIVANDGHYHLAFHTGSGATTVNLPATTAVPVGTTYVFSDADRLAGSGSAITINCAGFDLINSKTTSGGNYVMGINGQSITLVNIVAGSSGMWQITAQD